MSLFLGDDNRKYRKERRKSGLQGCGLDYKKEGIFAHVDLDTIYRVGKYRIDLKVLEK